MKFIHLARVVQVNSQPSKEDIKNNSIKFKAFMSMFSKRCPASNIPRNIELPEFTYTGLSTLIYSAMPATNPESDNNAVAGELSLLIEKFIDVDNELVTIEMKTKGLDSSNDCQFIAALFPGTNDWIMFTVASSGAGASCGANCVVSLKSLEAYYYELEKLKS